MTDGREKIIKIIDFWQKSVKNDELYSREVINAIDLKNKEIVDIVGPRRSGKSSILKLIIKRLNLKGDHLFINFEDPYFIENNGPEIIEEIIEVYLEYFSKNLKYLFFDEIQAINGWEKTIRKLRDGTDYKIFVTGSSSKLLSREISTLITGRHLSYHTLPLDFKEYLYFKKIDIDTKKEIVLKQSLIKKEFEEYLHIGGFPEVVLSGNKELLKNYFYDFIQKDVAARHEVRDREALEKMAIFLISNSAKIYSIESIKKAFSLSYESARDYLDYLIEAFLLFELKQFSFSLKKQSLTQKKVYSVDAGLAEAVSFRFSRDKGRILENAVYLELLRQKNEIYYYKTENNLEIDFLIKKKSNIKDLIQVSFDIENPKTRDRELKALKRAMRELKIKQATLITMYHEEVIEFDKKKINIMPAWRWMLK